MNPKWGQLRGASISMITILLMLGGSSACNRRGSAAAEGTSPQGSNAVLEESCIEAIVRWMVNAGDERGGITGVFFLELQDGGEPTFELLDRLSSKAIRMERRSSCKLSEDGAQPTECESGAVGTILSIGWSVRTSDGRIHVEVARHCGALCGQGGTLTLEKRGSVWAVLKYDMSWIS